MEINAYIKKNERWAVPLIASIIALIIMGLAILGGIILFWNI
jgi:hypothetical protein